MTDEALILAGGGGHTGYAYALSQVLQGRIGLRFLVPEDDLLSQKRMSDFGDVDYIVKPRGPRTSSMVFARLLMKGFSQSLRKITRDISVVVSSGSNFCIPPALTGWFKGIPLVNIESSVRFTSPSKTAKILQPFSSLTALQWQEQKTLLRNGVVVGPLLRKPEVNAWNGGYTLVTGGTYGHKALFDSLIKSDESDVVLQTGNVDPEVYRKAHPEWKIITVSEKFHELLAGADVVVTHFGSTVLDAVVYHKNIVIVPNPEWTRTAGLKDACVLASKTNAVLVERITTENIVSAIEEARKKEVPELSMGAETLADMIIEMVSSE